MYAHVGREEWIWRGLAIATIVALLGIAVMPLAVGDLGAVIGGIQAGMNANSWEQAVVNGAWNGFGAGVAGAGIYIGLLGLGVATGGTAFAVGLGVAFFLVSNN